MSAAHTPGPWRWELSRKSKGLQLVGGKPQFDLTVMDFERWGTSSATIRLRDLAHDGMNVMHKLHDRPDWIAPFPGRDHHAGWCADVVHPDARLMAAGPDLLKACQLIVSAFDALAPSSDARNEPLQINAARAAIAKATGMQP